MDFQIILEELDTRKRLLIVISVIGGVMILIGLSRAILDSRQVQVEYIDNDEIDSGVKYLVVDIEGAVEKPGVYELPSNSRVKDVLALSGGLSSEADRELVEKSFNLAQPLKDGQKIYIPLKTDDGTGVGYIRQEYEGKLININSASVSQLDTLDGIGATRAKAIVDGRPYGDPEELVERKILTRSVFEKIKSEIVVY